MLFNLSLKNIKKSFKDYSIYFITLVFAVCIFYIFNSIDAQNSMLQISSYKHDMAKVLVELMGYISVFVSVILGFLIVYSNNFLIKRRKKEIGLYFTLGMSKKKVSLILVIETLVVGVISLAVGLLLGVVLSQGLSIITAKLFEANMADFKFVFSSVSLMKTIIYFSIIFVLVMLFNLITLSRYKLIDLLNAGKKNEKVKIRNKYLTIITFILAVAFLGYAYYLLFNNALVMLNNDALVMIICGALGTFLFFLSLSGFLLRMIEMNKKLYFKNLNMFLLKQINNKINTTVVSTTIISLMLLLTIGILSGSISLAQAYNSNLSRNNKTDFTLYSNYSVFDIAGLITNHNELDKLEKETEFDKYVKDYIRFTYYKTPTIAIEDLMTDATINKLKKEYGSEMVTFEGNVSILTESDYNKILKLLGKKTIDIKEDQYLLTCNIEQIIEYYQEAISKNNSLTIGDQELTPSQKDIEQIAFINYNGDGNDGVLVVDDIHQKDLEYSEEMMIGNYQNNGTKEEMENDFISYLDEHQYNSTLLRTKLQMEASAVGIKVIVTFVGLYLGIIFALTSATVLAIGQLSESSDNKERYKVLRQIGASEEMIKKTLFMQILICFALPLGVALIHSYFGLREINKILKLIVSLDLTTNILLTSLFIIVLYGGYFLATYLCSKNIIKEN